MKKGNCCHSLQMLIMMMTIFCCLLLLVNVDAVKEDANKGKAVVEHRANTSGLAVKQNIMMKKAVAKKETQLPIPTTSTNRIKNLRAGELKGNIILKIVAADIVRVMKNQQKSWIVVGSDGTHFVTIKVFNQKPFQRLSNALGSDFLNKIFAFQNVVVFPSAQALIQGDIPLELRVTKNSSIQEIPPGFVMERALKRMNTQLYFRQFLRKKAVNDKSFELTSLENLAALPSEYTGSVDVMASIESVSQVIQKYPTANGEHHRVVNVILFSKKEGIVTKCQVSAWDLLADFFAQILADKEWHDKFSSPIVLKLQGLGISKKHGNKNLSFSNESRISLWSRTKERIPETLEDLIEKHGKLQMHIRLKILNIVPTSGTDGVDKCQLLFLSSANKFELGQEFTLKEAEVVWSGSGVLTLLVESFVLHKDHFILTEPAEFVRMDYPTKAVILPSSSADKNPPPPSSSAENFQMSDDEEMSDA